MKLENDKLTVPEAAEAVGRHVETIRRWIRDGDLEAEKMRGRSGYEYLISEDDLLDALKVEQSNDG